MLNILLNIFMLGQVDTDFIFTKNANILEHIDNETKCSINFFIK